MKAFLFMSKFILKTPVEKLAGIYKITSPTKKVYIGQSFNIYNRMLTYNRLDCKRQLILYNSLKKYGVKKHTFEVLEYCDIELLNEKERYYQDLYSVIDRNGMNLVLTKAEDRPAKKSKETIERHRKKISSNIENSNRLREFNKKRSIKVKCFDRYTNELIGEYPSIKEAERQTGVNAKCIHLSINGSKYKYHSGKYYER